MPALLSGILSVQIEMKCQVPVKRLTTLVKRTKSAVSQGPAMPDTPTKDAAEDGKEPAHPGLPHQASTYRVFYTHHEETRQRMKASQDV